MTNTTQPKHPDRWLIGALAAVFGGFAVYVPLSRPDTKLISRVGDKSEVLYTPNRLPPLSSPELFSVVRHSQNKVGEDILIRFADSPRTVNLHRETLSEYEWSINRCGWFRVTPSDGPSRRGIYCLTSYPAPLI